MIFIIVRVFFSSLNVVICLAIFVNSISDSNAAEFIVSPTDTESAISQTVELYCKISGTNGNNMVWLQRPVTTQVTSTVYINGNIRKDYRPRFSVKGNATSGECNLIIRNVRPEDAGIYLCIYETLSKSAELIVLNLYPSDKVCSTNISADGAISINSCDLEKDTVEISCNLSYRGNIKPEIECKSGDGIVLNPQLPFNYETTTYRFTRKADSLNCASVTCRTKYSTTNISSCVEWTMPINCLALQVNTTIKQTSCVSERVVCSVPQLHQFRPKYSWRKGTVEISSDAILNPNSLSHGSYLCIVDYIVRNKSCTNEVMKINYTCYHETVPGKSADSLPIVLGVVLPIVIILLITIIIFVVKKLLPQCKGGTVTMQGLQDRLEELDTLNSRGNNRQQDQNTALT